MDDFTVYPQTEEPTPLFNVDTTAPGQIPLSPAVASERAYKASLGIPKFEMNTQQITNELLAGQEETVRKAAASHIDMLKNQYKQQIISNIAAKSGGPLSPEDTAYIRALIDEKPTDHTSVFEEFYSREFMSNLKRTGDLSNEAWWKDTPEKVKDHYLTQGTEFETKRQLLLTEMQDTRAIVESQSTIGYIADIAKTIIPFYTEVLKRGNIPGVSGLYPLGTNLAEQSDKFFQQPLEEFKKTLVSIRPLRERNPQLYLTFLDEMLGQSTNEKVLNNVFTAVDLSFIKPFAIAGGARALKTQLTSAAAARSAFKSFVKNAEEPATKATIAEAAGDIQEAAVQQGTTKFISEMKGSNNPFQDARDSLQNIFKGEIDATTANPGTFRQEIVNRLNERYSELASKLINTLSTTARVDRLAAVIKVETAVRDVLKGMSESYPGLNNRLLNISTPKLEPISNTYHVDFFIGDNNGKLFGSVKDAQTFANQTGLKGAIVGEETQRGTKYVIKVTKPIRETDNVIRNALIATKESKTPDSWLNAWGGVVGGLRTPEEVLSLEQNMNRKIATYAPSTLFKIAKETAQEIKQLKGWNLPGTKGREKWNEWTRVIDEAKSLQSTRTGEQGDLFSSPLELSQLYQRMLQRTPDEQELAAAFAYKRQRLVLKALRNIQAYRNKARIGAETITIRALDEARATAKFTPYTERTFDAVPINHYPKGRDTVLLMWGDKLGRGEEIFVTDTLRGKKREILQREILSGKFKVYQLTNPEDLPLQGFGTVGDQRVRYVITRNSTNKPLSWNQFKNEVADFDYDHYVKQAIMKLDKTSKYNWYEGDATIAAFNVRALGKDFAEKLDRIRVLIKENKIDEARAISIGKSFDEVHAWFKPTLTAAGKTIAPRLSLENPIRIVPRHRLLNELDGSLKEKYGAAFRDGTVEGYGRQFSEKPDPYEIFTARNTGTKANPLYNVEPAKFLDPITSINRALTKAIHSTWLDDYKIFSIETWIQEAKPYLRASPKELAAKPYYYFFHGEFRNTDDVVKVNNLKTARFQIQQFLGIENQTTTFLHDIAQKLTDSIYNKVGPSSAAMIPQWVLPKLRDPFSFMRAVTFHAKLGLFAVPQLMVQLQTYSAILGVAGFAYAAPGAKAALMHALTKYNSTPEIVAHLDKLMTKQLLPGTSRWLPGQFTEAQELMARTGFGNVAGEHVLRDNPFKYDIISSKGKDFLDWGTMFFREGERNVRFGAFYTSYREFRDLKPTGRITEADLRTILQRADLLTVNMSRASASTLHQGVFSIPTQFLSYQLRLSELFLGKRLTDVERGRLIATYSLLYGIPGAYGLTGLPFGDYVQKWAREDGYVVGENWASTAINEGIPSLLIGLATGQYYNVGERYGAQGFEQFRDAMRSDKTMWDILGGAAFSTFSNTLSRSDGFFAATTSLFRDDSTHFNLKIEDLADVFKEISSVNNAWKLIMAANTGKWLTKKEGYLTDASMASATFMFLSGLQPQAATDLNLMSWTRKDEKALQQHALDQFIREYRRALREMDNNNPTQASDYFRRAKTYLTISGYPEEDMGKAFSLAAKDQESIINRIRWDFFTEKVPETRKERAFEALPRSLRMDQ